MSETVLLVPREFQIVKVKIGKAAEERIARLRAKGPYGSCLGCEREIEKDERVTCGQCSTCYNGSLYAISKGRKTRAGLIREGKMLSPTGGGRKPANEFTRSLSESA